MWVIAWREEVSARHRQAKSQISAGNLPSPPYCRSRKSSARVDRNVPDMSSVGILELKLGHLAGPWSY